MEFGNNSSGQRGQGGRMELLAPAGNFEKGKVAIAYGADAIYLAGQRFGLRARAGNFSAEELKEMVDYAHGRGVRVYVTLNIIPHNRDLAGMPEYLEELGEVGVDALIVADPSVMVLAKAIIPQVELHLSTQASMTNWRSAWFWAEQGVSRIVLARELGFEEIREIRAKVPQVELEVFVHGAMCISYSGRCLLSAYMAGRDANLGDCAQACRWKYSLVEERRPGEYYPVEETETGTFVFNSKDLCLIDELPALSAAGVHSLKIEGRMKSVHYVATVVSVYREALDRFYDNPAGYTAESRWLEDLDKVSHRPYTSGFFHGDPGKSGQDYAGNYVGTHDFVGMVNDFSPDSGIAVVDVRNKITVGETLEMLIPKQGTYPVTVNEMTNAKNGEPLSEAHPNYQVRMKVPTSRAFAILRRPS